ncbi:hypothetical protein AUP68_06257 [Ilyonectria robusta]
MPGHSAHELARQGVQVAANHLLLVPAACPADLVLADPLQLGCLGPRAPANMCLLPRGDAGICKRLDDPVSLRVVREGCRMVMPAPAPSEATLRKWREPYDDAARLLGAEDTDSPSASSSPATDGSEFMSNAVPVGREVSSRSRSSCRATAVLRRDEEDEEDDGPDGELSRSWARTDVSKRKDGPSSGSSEGGGGGGGRGEGCRDVRVGTCQAILHAGMPVGPQKRLGS